MTTAAAADERLASLAKPPGSLGTLEEWAKVLCTVQDTLTPVVDPCSCLIFCADHGVKKADDALSPVSVRTVLEERGEDRRVPLGGHLQQARGGR